MYKKIFSVLGAVVLATVPTSAGSKNVIQGDYVEARTAEVFAGGCIMGSEAETAGRHAVMAWRVTGGSHEGVVLDGLSVVAAVVGDRNLGIEEIGGVPPTRVKSTILVDERASFAQQEALVSLAHSLSQGLTQNILEVTAVPISFERTQDEFSVVAADAKLIVSTEMVHDPDCGAMQWFHPLSDGTEVQVGVTKSQVYSGAALGAKWQQADKKSAFFGTFTY